METLELLKLDMANFTIQQMRPHIQQQVVAYEQKKFKELLETQKGKALSSGLLDLKACADRFVFPETGIDGLEATKEWLSRAQQRIKDGKPIGGFKYESGPTPSAVCNEAFMEIFVWTCEHLFPEVSQRPAILYEQTRFTDVTGAFYLT